MKANRYSGMVVSVSCSLQELLRKWRGRVRASCVETGYVLYDDIARAEGIDESAEMLKQCFALGRPFARGVQLAPVLARAASGEN